MQKRIIMAVSLLILALSAQSQYVFVTPSELPDLTCHVNVNERSDQNFRNDLKRAVFRLTIPGPGGGNCSATLVNRNTGQNSMGQYFITAWHCFKSGENCGGSEFDFNTPVTMTFNYQSPNSLNVVFSENAAGHAYQISRQVRLVDKFSCPYGDFALCEILGPPIPPHFNVYYAGWYPNELLINQNGQFATIHHPGASIKKISAVDKISGTGPPKGVCRVVTKILDFLFGWLWKRKWSTQVICTYIQVPYFGTKYKAANYNFGTVEPGSSGGGLFTGSSGFAGANRLIGDLSATVPNHHCDVFIDIGITYFGKFADSYYRQSVKNTLNPPGKYWIDQGGIPGRQISCYPQLNLNAETTGGFNLYPANLYQQDNLITLSSQTTTNTNGIIRVKTGANFVFQAGQSVNLNAGFEVEAGAVFTAAVTGSPCYINNGTYRQMEPASPTEGEYETPDMNEVFKNIPLPEEKKFNLDTYLASRLNAKASGLSKFNLFPNPSTGQVQVDIFLKDQTERLSLTIYDMSGKQVYARSYGQVFFVKDKLDLSSLNSGVYNIVIRTVKGMESKKIVIAR